MGLISAGLNALGGTLASQWREYFYVDAMPADVLATKAMKRINGRFGGSKTEDDNVISDGSIIVVNEGQCMMIVDQGKIVDFCAEPGEYKFELNGEPTLLYGDFNGEKVMTILKQTFDRFSFGGQAGKDQRVYFFNTRELTGNKYGTPGGVPFLVVDRNIGLYQEINIRMFGEYSYKITNPMLFFTNVCGNVSGDYTRDELDSQLKSELLTALGPALAKISEKGIRYSALPGHNFEIAEELNNVLSAKWAEKRGIEIVEFGISSVKASEEDEKMIKDMQRAAMLSNPNLAAGYTAGARGQAMQDAANNTAGAAVGFMGMNMAGGNGNDVAQMFQMGQQYNMQMQQAAQQTVDGRESVEANSWQCACGAKPSGKFCPECGSKKPEPKPADTWKCPACGKDVSGKFCPECGAKKPAEDGWTCACGAVNKGKFCAECGAKKPAGEPLYQCDKCGWKPADPKNPPRFCPECGDPFDENDAK
ncbi:MAG: SPFH domain-containing protein [Clostridiales bacterium]|nr:SPFH domain-containing protein [Clostridiales bacterium]